LGIHKYSLDHVSPYPLLNLERRLAAAFDATDRPFPPNHQYHFRALQGSIVAPDHCIIGNIKNVLDVSFVSLDSAPHQRLLNQLFRQALIDNTLPRQRQVFNVSSKSLHSVTFSSLFAIFLVYPSVFSQFSSFTGVELRSATRDALDVGCALHSLVSNLYFWPKESSDGMNAVDYVFGSGKRAYYESLQSGARAYLQQVNQFYVDHKELGETLDVPNLHRLLELTIHTLPRYGHIRNVSDLTFEHKHQSLKRSFHRGGGNQANHNWSLQSDLTDEWKSSLTWSYATLREASLSQRNRQLYTNFLLSCFIGRSRITSVHSYSVSFQRDAVEVFRGMCTPSFVAELTFLSHMARIHRPAYIFEWVWPRSDQPPSHLTANRTNHERMSIEALIESHFDTNVRSKLRVSKTVKARRAPTSQLEEGRLFSFTNVSDSSPLSYTIFTFLLAVLVPNGSIYVLCKLCPEINDGSNVNVRAGLLCRVPPVRGEGQIYLIRLTSAVRRVACYHSCNSSCKLNDDGFPEHSSSVRSGGIFRVHTRLHGYPPRAG